MDVFEFYRKKGYSILCLQDTHFITESEPIIESQWGYQCIFNSYKSNARGVCLLFNNSFEFHIHNIKKDGEGNFLAVDLTIEETRVTLVNIYGPNSDQPGFYENIRNIFLELDNEYFILCGDFNLVLNPDIDTYNYKYINNPKAREKLLEIMDDLQIVDYYRVLNPGKKIYTWRKKTPLKQSRLDYILISNSLSNIVENFDIKSGYRSDHSIVILELKFNPFERGRGLWKFNSSLLTDMVFIDKVKETIDRVKSQYAYNADIHTFFSKDIDDSIFLEVLLMEIRGLSISYSSHKKKEREKIEISLVNEITSLESQEHINFELIEQKKSNLENLRKRKLQGHFIRSRARWIEQREKPTKYFLNLESRNFLNKTIKKSRT